MILVSDGTSSEPFPTDNISVFSAPRGNYSSVFQAIVSTQIRCKHHKGVAVHDQYEIVVWDTTSPELDSTVSDTRVTVCTVCGGVTKGNTVKTTDNSNL
ncbi:MAG TPA: hypothetical protein VFK94_04225 [Patescibacteria group bacterium]|nr:hypothetical protein [Patescibacteria group bacterium]